MTSEEWATLIPAIVAVLGALAAWIRIEVVNQTAKSANTTANAASTLAKFNSQDITAHLQVAHSIERPMIMSEAPEMNAGEVETQTGQDGLALMGLAAPAPAPAPAPATPVAAPEAPQESAEAPQVDSLERVRDDLESVLHRLRSLV